MGRCPPHCARHAERRRIRTQETEESGEQDSRVDVQQQDVAAQSCLKPSPCAVWVREGHGNDGDSGRRAVAPRDAMGRERHEFTVFCVVASQWRLCASRGPPRGASPLVLTLALCMWHINLPSSCRVSFRPPPFPPTFVVVCSLATWVHMPTQRVPLIDSRACRVSLSTLHEPRTPQLPAVLRTHTHTHIQLVAPARLWVVAIPTHTERASFSQRHRSEQIAQPHTIRHRYAYDVHVGWARHYGGGSGRQHRADASGWQAALHSGRVLPCLLLRVGAGDGTVQHLLQPGRGTVRGVPEQRGGDVGRVQHHVGRVRPRLPHALH